MWTILKNLRTTRHRLLSTFVPEPEEPCIITSIPGPATCAMKGELENFQASPKLPLLTTTKCATCANEGAITAMMKAYQNQERSGCVSDVSLKTAINNQHPGSPDLSILSFKGSDHGCETMGALSMSHSNAEDKVDVTAFDWPIAQFPRYKHPLNEFECYNKHQDKKCLQSVRELLSTSKENGSPIAGVMVEPIQNKGTYEASADFFRDLQEICKENGCFLCMDETKTCCGVTGTLWCHEQFGLKCPPDVVTFGNQAQLSGYFHSEELCSQGNCACCGDPTKMLAFERILKTIDIDSLLCNVQHAGEILHRHITQLEMEYFPLIDSVRGKGVFIAFNAQNEQVRDDLVERLRGRGMLVDTFGHKTISLRPSLTFNLKHVELFAQILAEVLDDAVAFSSSNPCVKWPEIKKPCQKKKKQCPRGTERDRCSKEKHKKPLCTDKCTPKKKKPCDD
ncbi:4-aminobutyrate aminotransferase, mitochondrial isoform X2 [Aethina tumida]|uniref:4-aminobutyrate aminotransferase, mitochondrial isoform X2 n=1 Tax=Aethina tumida TaxID=116153 RepID=UPI00096B38FA|nr:4-aminobutyrate aminotransferase, mitochondrial isoform X2 [Aethina tumida]